MSLRGLEGCLSNLSGLEAQHSSIRSIGKRIFSSSRPPRNLQEVIFPKKRGIFGGSPLLVSLYSERAGYRCCQCVCADVHVGCVCGECKFHLEDKRRALVQGTERVEDADEDRLSRRY